MKIGVFFAALTAMMAGDFARNPEVIKVKENKKHRFTDEELLLVRNAPDKKTRKQILNQLNEKYNLMKARENESKAFKR